MKIPYVDLSRQYKQERKKIIQKSDFNEKVKTKKNRKKMSRM